MPVPQLSHRSAPRASPENRASQQYIRRFSLGRIIEHQINALVFLTLVATGLAQRFHGAEWAQWTVTACGGIDTTRLIHRGVGALFALLVVQHLVVGLFLIIWRREAPSMLVNRKDFSDAIDNLRFYFGLRHEPARCDRYDYKQKFEYWGVIMGGFLMIGTGLILWFPTELFASMPFLPGQIVPAAKVAHANEAMMAFLIIVTWHIYNAVFSPEVFPFDTSIFTGKISVERMRHEHPVELDKISAAANVPLAAADVSAPDGGGGQSDPSGPTHH